MQSLVLSHQETEALRVLLIMGGGVMVRQAVAPELRNRLLAKFNLEFDQGEVVSIQRNQEQKLYHIVDTDDGGCILIMSTPTENRYWFRLMSPQGDELETGMYELSPWYAEAKGRMAWESRRLEGIDQKEDIRTTDGDNGKSAGTV
jgi:hypothetical protein